MTDYSDTKYPKTCLYLAAIGIDPMQVSVNGFSLDGYEEIQLDETGKRILDGDRLATKTRTWPGTLVAAYAVKTFESEGGEPE
jgi:hypothetical protein